MLKGWRTQQVNNTKDEVQMKHNSVAELWWETFKKLNPNRTLKSLESEGHELDPFNYSLSIPNAKYLKDYDSTNAINALLGKIDKVELTDKKELATIYHELFHVYQSNISIKVFDYFYLIDKLQKTRKELLEYMGYSNFYILAESTKTDFGKTVFHSVENYVKLGDKESFSNMLNNELAESYNEIDDDTEKLIIKDGESNRETILQQAQVEKNSYKMTIEKQLDNQCQIIDQQAPEIKKYSDLSRSHIESLIEFFKVSNDVDLNLFHLIEGSAQIFGWCCAGYNVNYKLKEHKLFLEKHNVSNDTYEKAYELFQDNGGQTPFIFVLLSTFALSIQNPIDTYLFGLQKVTLIENELQALFKNSNMNILTVTERLTEVIENIYRGNKYTKNMTSIYDKENTDSFFIQKIHEIREEIPNIVDPKLFSELILNTNTSSTLIKLFEEQEKSHSHENRKNEVLRDFEQFLYDSESDFGIKCCKEHGYVEKFDYQDWLNCTNNDSFITILNNDFNIKLPNKFKGE